MTHTGLLQLPRKSLSRQLPQRVGKAQHAQGIEPAVPQQMPAVSKTRQPRGRRLRRKIFAWQRLKGNQQTAQPAFGSAREGVLQQGTVAPVQAVVATDGGRITGFGAQR